MVQIFKKRDSWLPRNQICRAKKWTWKFMTKKPLKLKFWISKDKPIKSIFLIIKTLNFWINSLVFQKCSTAQNESLFDGNNSRTVSRCSWYIIERRHLSPMLSYYMCLLFFQTLWWLVCEFHLEYANTIDLMIWWFLWIERNEWIALDGLDLDWINDIRIIKLKLFAWF